MKNEKINISEEVIEPIREHFKKSCSKCKDDWNINEANENMTTGALLSLFATSEWCDCNEWKWKITVKPTGSTNAETISGADGIITVKVENNGVVKNKSIIFQAKKKGNAQKLKSQIKKMTRFLPGGNMLIIYSKDGIWGQTAGKKGKYKRMDIADYMPDVFLKCVNGRCGVTCENIQQIIKANKNNAAPVPAHSMLVTIKKDAANPNQQ